MYNGLTFRRSKQYKTIQDKLTIKHLLLEKTKEKLQELNEILGVHYCRKLWRKDYMKAWYRAWYDTKFVGAKVSLV